MASHQVTRRRAVVLGGGLAGTLAALVLTKHFDDVSIIERHQLPTGPEPRRGVPQAHHTHLLWSGGARAIEDLIPGIMARWAAAGALRIGFPDGAVVLSEQGWFRRWPDCQYVIAASRDLIDWVIRDQVLASPGVNVLESVDALGLSGDQNRVTGVRLRDQRTGEVSQLAADFVVDATGRGSSAPQWLTELGLASVREESVDSGLSYATRAFSALPGAESGFPLITVQANPRVPVPGRAANLLPIENGRWLVTLSSTRGAELPDDEEGFVQFARDIRHPIIGDIIAAAAPLGPIHRSHSTINRRRYYEEVARWPDGFVVLGDAVATYNPIYGHGMSVAAHSVTALKAGLDQRNAQPGTAKRVQHDVARAVDGAWVTATSQDILYPGAIGAQPTATTRLLQRYLSRLTRAVNGNHEAARAVFGAFSLSVPMTHLVKPRVVLATILDAGEPPIIQPPLTADESAIIAGRRDGRAPL